MAFWNEKIVEPKRKFRWELLIDGIPAWTIKKVNRPSYEVAEAEHKFINHTFYFPGRVTYNTVSFTIVDVANPDAAETLKQMLYASGYALPKDVQQATQTITKQAGITALGDVVICMFGGGGIADPSQPNTRPGTDSFGAGGGVVADSGANGYNDEGIILESWKLYNAWIKKIEFSELDYDGDDLVEITIELRYDFAELNGTDAVVPGTLNVDPARKPTMGYGQPVGDVPARQD